MKQVNDLETDLDENIDLSNLSNSKIKLSALWKNIINDIFSFSKKDLNIITSKTIKISKNKTNNFDTLYSTKNESVIDIITPKKNINYFLKIIKNFFKKHFIMMKLSSPKKQTKFKKSALFFVFLTFILFWNK